MEAFDPTLDMIFNMGLTHLGSEAFISHGRSSKGCPKPLKVTAT